MINWLTRILTISLCAIFIALNPVFADQNEEAYKQWEKENASATKAYEEGRYSEALSLYQTALSSAEKITYGGPRGITYYGMARTYHKDRKLTEAEEYFKKALEILDASQRRRSSYLVACIKDYAALLKELGRHQEAAEMEGRLKPQHQTN